MFLYAQLALILSTAFFNASFIKGVHSGRQGVDRLPIGEASSTYSHGLLEKQNRHIK